MSISLTVLLVLAGVVLLAFGFGSTGGAIRFLAGGGALLVAIAATAATILLFWVGQRAHWTSDGPGMLFVMIALVVCAIVAAVSWMFVLKSRNLWIGYRILKTSNRIGVTTQFGLGLDFGSLPHRASKKGFVTSGTVAHGTSKKR